MQQQAMMGMGHSDPMASADPDDPDSGPILEAKRGAASEIIWKLAQGNKRYVNGMGNPSRKNKKPLVEQLIEDPLRPQLTEALVIACARSFAPVDVIFDTEPGQLEVIR